MTTRSRAMDRFFRQVDWAMFSTQYRDRVRSHAYECPLMAWTNSEHIGYVEAAMAKGLTEDETQQIIAAADNMTDLDKYFRPRLRKRMLNAMAREKQKQGLVHDEQD